jgi:nicotinate-nucleotide adenylyltransferase
MACPDMSVGLLGGSFNPAHSGHLHITRHALKRLGLDRVWWLVTPGNPLKSKRELEPLSARLARAAELAADPRIDVTAFEALRRDVYTVDTLRYLRARFPGTRFMWLMGADNLAGFHRWRDWQSILQLVSVAVLDRPGCRYAARSSHAAICFRRSCIDESDANGLAVIRPPAWTYLTIPMSSISSTEIRQKG